MNKYQVIKCKLKILKLKLNSLDTLKRFKNITVFQYMVKNQRLYIVSSSCCSYTSFLNDLKEKDELIFKDILLGLNQNQSDTLQLKLNNDWFLVEYQYIYKRKHLYRIEGLLIHINDLKKYENQLLEISRKDGLTYLYNKVTVEEMIKNEIENLKQGTLLMGDIDSFKKLNDQLGHLQGDQILKWFASQLNEVFHSDVIGRIGGDEFVVFMKDTQHNEIIRKLNMLFDKVMYQYEKVPFSISVGIASYNGQDTYEEFFNKADWAMYKAKTLKQKFYIYEE
ncbi:GGDEF domain-containing protein [Longibaculum muris]|nr:GGDEF domain-containing protein [Longibaculum muris]